MHKRKKRLLVIGVLVLSLIGWFLTSPALAEEKVTVPQDAIKPKYFSQLSATQLAQSKVTVPKSWVKESYFEKDKKEESSQVSAFSDVNWRWGLKMINAPQAWKYTKGEGIVVAVIGGGVNFGHPALQGKAWTNPGEVPGNGKDDDGSGYVDDVHGWDFILNQSDSDRLHFHGNFVANLAAGNLGHSGQGGVAPRVRIMDLRVYDEDGNLGLWEDFIGAFDYALANGADIINLSVGFDYSTNPSYSFFQTIRRVASEIIIVGSAGNKSSKVQPPASEEQVWAITALDRNGEIYNKSNTGQEVIFSAPGVSVSSAYGDSYHTGSGSSFAAPHVTGVVALMLSANPDLEPREVQDILAKTARDLGPPGRDDKFGHGLVDAEAAVKKALEMKKES